MKAVFFNDGSDTIFCRVDGYDLLVVGNVHSLDVDDWFRVLGWVLGPGVEVTYHVELTPIWPADAQVDADERCWNGREPIWTPPKDWRP